MRRGEDNRVIIAYLVMAGLMLGLFVIGNIAWQHWYCGSPIAECRAFAAIPCEPIAALEAKRVEYTRLARAYDSAKAE